MKFSIVASLAFLACGSGPVWAAEVSLKSDDVIAGRQAAFDLQQGVSDAMKAAIAADGPVKPLTGGAKAIAAWGRVIPSQFPDGTQSGHDTKAKSEIWSDPAGFAKAAANLVSAADKLAILADADDKPGFAAQYADMAKTCGACHRAYRNR